MIQRIQSLLLLLVGTLMVFTVFGTISTFTPPPAQGTLPYVFKLTDPGNSPVLAAVAPRNSYLLSAAGLATIMAFVSIFLFKKRELQLKIAALTAFLISLFAALTVYKVYAWESVLGQGAKTSYGISYFFPLIAVLLCVGAIRLIRKDIALLKSVDRIR